MRIEISVESERGCGFRKPGATGVGIYLVGDGPSEWCERIPHLLDVCPCCGAGIKQSRGFTWVSPGPLFKDAPPCNGVPGHHHEACPMCRPEEVAGERAGLMWVGERYYPTPDDFLREAQEMGVSKKIAAVPNDFVIGEHWVYLAHPKASTRVEPDDETGKLRVMSYPGIFYVFKPVQIDLVVKSVENIPERAVNIAERLGDDCRIVQVVREEIVQPAML